MWGHRIVFLVYFTISTVNGSEAFAPSLKSSNKNQFFNNNNNNVLRPSSKKNKNNRNGLSQLASAIPFSSSSAPPANETAAVAFAGAYNGATTTTQGSALQAPTTSTTTTPVATKLWSGASKTVLSTCALLMLDFAFKRMMKVSGISFPSNLAGMGVLFATLLIAPFGESLYQILKPGSDLMAKWLQVFLVPNLVVLPLAPALGSSMEIAKITAVIGGGFYATVLACAYAVLGVRKFSSNNNAVQPVVVKSEVVATAAKPATAQAPAKPISDATVTGLRKAFLGTTLLSIVATRSAGLSGLATPLASIGMLLATFHHFVFGARLPKKFTKICHPLVTCTSLTWLNLKFLGMATGSALSFKGLIKTYKTGSKALGLSMGAGDLLLWCLSPAIVALACQMYERRKLMKENMAELGAALGVSTFGGLFGTAALVRLLGLGANPAVGLALLSRNITSALAMVAGSVLGADVCLTVSIAIITGLLGAWFGGSILDTWGIQDPVARGLAVGASSHGLGTAAIKDEKDAFPFAAISMALTATISTVIVSIPTFKTALIKLALGAP